MCPDLGATTDLISKEIAKKVGMDIRPNQGEWSLTDTQGAPVEISGVGTVKLSRPGGKWKTHMLVVCSKLSDPMLLSWATQKSLGILHMTWPWEDYSMMGGVNLDTWT